MQQLSRTLVRTGIFLVTFGVMMGLLLLCGWLPGWLVFRDSYDGIVLTGLRYTAVFAYVACPIALAGGIGTGLAGARAQAQGRHTGVQVRIARPPRGPQNGLTPTAVAIDTTDL